ncbi:MAG: signal recognition particle subunit SRP19/SEC65 family protein [Thermoplasmata archaeon]
MVRTRADHLVLWPSYFDSTKSRARGRRIPKSLAVQNPTSEELLAAVEALGLDAKLHPGKSYPGFWWERGGCISVEKTLKKTELISKVAPRLKRMRQ